MKALHNIEVGTRFVGNVDYKTYKVIAIKLLRDTKHKYAIVLQEETNMICRIGLEALKRYNITIIN